MDCTDFRSRVLYFCAVYVIPRKFDQIRSFTQQMQSFSLKCTLQIWILTFWLYINTRSTVNT